MHTKPNNTKERKSEGKADNPLLASHLREYKNDLRYGATSKSENNNEEVGKEKEEHYITVNKIERRTIVWK